MLVFALSACETPYSLSIGDYDEEGSQKAAAIEVSDPQIYTRENLINDRRKEIARLTELLNDSKNQKFVPQLRRDLREISTFTGSLQASFNPALGAAAGRAEEQVALEEEIARANLRTELATAQERQLLAERRVSAIESGATPEGQAPSARDTQDADTTVAPELPDLKNVQSRLDGLSKKLDKVLSEVPDVAATDIPSTPREKFRDEQAYRGEIRAAIAENNLDDLHDATGNALYRMQFRATLLPGERKGQYGITRMHVKPPKFRAEEIRDLYFAWLGHVTQQLNLALASDRSANWRYETLGATGDLYDIVYFIYADEKDSNTSQCVRTNRSKAIPEGCNALRLAVPRPYGVGLQELTDMAPMAPILADELRRLSKAADAVYADSASEGIELEKDTAVCKEALSTAWVRNWFASAAIARTPEELIEQVQSLQRFLPIVASSVRALQTAVPRIGDRAASAIRDLLAELNRTNTLTQNVLLPLQHQFPDCPGFVQGELRAALSNSIPESFLRPLIASDGIDPAKEYAPAPGYRAYTYAAKPVELAQQISTAASAGNALELSLALSATVPSSGVSAEGSAGYMRAAIGRIEALERTPIVVGYATTETQNSKDGSTEFGWVFGPPVVPDTEESKLERRQRLVSHQVLADVSVPGWWPRLSLEIETAWIANWHDGDGALAKAEDKRSRTVWVDLPRNRANLESLTDTVARAFWGRQPGTTQIYDVQPKRIYVCPGQTVQFLVFGSDVWRNASVFLNGSEAKSNTVRVLPDMAGVTAAFDLSEVAPSGEEADKSVLTVWTQNGSDRFSDIHLLKPPPDSNVCR